MIEKPVRIIVLKSRRMGVSTHVQARFAKGAATCRTFHGLTGAHLDESSAYLHGMTEKMIDNLPSALRPEKRTGIQGKRIEFRHGGSLRTFTAGGREGVGRATAANALHCSERAFWPDQKSTLTALLQVVPDEPGTIIVQESTANGVGDEFHQDCLTAMQGESDYVFFFAAWFEFPDYALSDEATDAAFAKQPELDTREQALADQGVTRNQLAWRRWAITNLCSGDHRIFDQEYPDSPDVAFLTSGRPYFHPDAMDAFNPVKPSRIGGLDGWIKSMHEMDYRVTRDTNGPLRIWTPPVNGREYIVFGDPAGKVTLETHDARPVGAKDDYCCAQVIDRETGEQVAEWHAHIDPDLFGDELAKLGLLYGKALLAVETTGGYGNATIARLYRGLGYGNLYMRQQIDTTTEKWSEKIGWDTTEATRPIMLDTLRARLRDNPHLLKSDGLKREMRTFVHGKNGKPAAQTGAHDDRVMAMAGALEVWRERAQRPEPKPKSKTTRFDRLHQSTDRRPRVSA